MAQDAELKLKVSLDLAYFRQQLAGLGQAAAGYNIPIQVKFDRRSVQNELNALSSNIRRRSYFLEVKTNLKSEIDNAATLAKALAELERLGQKTKGVANRAAAGAGASAVDAAKFQSMVNRATKPALEGLYAQMAKAKIPMGDVGKGTVAELRAAIISGVPRITQDIAQGLANGLDPKLKENGLKGAKLFIDAFKDASGIASPSKVFKQIGEFSADGLEIGFINGLKDFKNKAVAEIKKIAALMKLELASVGDVRIGADIGAIRGGVRGGTQYGAPIGPLQTGSREPWGRGTRGMYGGGGFEPYMAGAGRQLPAAFTRIPGISPTTSTANMLGVGLPALPAAGMSSAAGMRQAELFAREAAARARSAERGLAVMQENAIASRVSGQVPLGGGGPFLPPGRGPGGGAVPPKGFPSEGMMGPSSTKGYEALTRLSGALQSSNAFFSKTKLPLAGAVEELAGEFGNATKQVLLYGTAYKGLAFLIDLPNQALNAAKSLQTFNNQLEAITGSSQKADQAFSFVDNLASRFNIPLDSARQGFVKLYASMAPAGFSTNQIENLFTGISKASATLGLSADKVDRVTYAFAQMASKGQLMSEEVSGQLGDVIPGALSIMAEAARMDIATFKKAMEDGVFVGKTFEQVMSNVPIVLENRFGKGAAGAAKTLQGSMNALAISTQKFYESFEPIVSMGATAIFPAIASAVGDATTAVKAFSAAMQGNEAPAKMLDGNAAQLYGILRQLKEIFDAVSNVVKNIAPTLGILGKAVLTVAEYIAKLINTPIGQFLADFAAKAGVALIAVQLFARTGLLVLIAKLIEAARNAQLAGTGMLGFAGTLGRASVAVRLFRLALTGIIGAAIIAGIEKIIQSIGRMANRLSDARKNALATAQAIRSMSATELIGEKGKVQRNIFLLQKIQRAGGKVSGSDMKAAQDLGLNISAIPGRGKSFGGKVKEPSTIQSYIMGQERLLTEIEYAYKNLDQPTQALGQVDLGAGGKDGQKTSKLEPYDRSKLKAIQEEFDKGKRILDNKLLDEKISKTSYGIKLAEITAIKEKAEAEEGYRLEVLKTNRDNMSASDKALKLFDLEKAKKDELLAVEERRSYAIKKATAEIRAPFKDALKDVNNEIEGQGMLIDNLRNGYMELTTEQQAQLLIEQQTKNLSADEYRNIEDTIRALKEKLRIRIENNKLIEQEQNLASLRAQIGTTGAGMGAGFIGEAGGAYERALLDSQGNKEYATQMAQLTERLGLLKQQADLTQQSIQGIGNAFATTLVDGMTSLADGSKTTQEVFANLLNNLAQILADAAKQMIATYIAIGIARMFAMGGGGGNSVANLNAGAAQYGGGAGAPATIMDFGGIIPKANGGVFVGGFQAFANGGVVQGPTLGLVGEGRYNEAIVPLPDGKSIPVELGGAMGGTNITVNVDAKGTKVAGDQGASQTLARDLAAVVDQRLVYHKRAGGLLSR